MVRKELNEIISGKGFDGYFSNLRNEIQTSKITCEHEYSFEEEDPFLMINLSNVKRYGYMIIWEKGEYGARLTDSFSEQVVVSKFGKVRSGEDFYDKLDTLFSYLKAASGENNF